MKPGSKKLTPMLFAAILMLTLIQLPFAPSASASPVGTGIAYTMPAGAMTFTDTDPPGWTAPTAFLGRNILTAYYNYDTGTNSLHFQVNLDGPSIKTNWPPTSASSGERLEIFINYKPGGNGLGTNSNNAPAGLVGMDYYLELQHIATTSGTGTWQSPAAGSAKYYVSTWTTVPTDAFTPKWYASDPNSTSLQWNIPLGGVNPTAVPFDFYVVTNPQGNWGADRGDGSTSDVTPKFHTPIPSAAWLLGSGIIGLIGLKRRKARIA